MMHGVDKGEDAERRLTRGQRDSASKKMGV